MLQITQLTNDTFQEQTLILSDGTTLFLQLYFVPMQQGWFMPTLTYQNFTLDGLRITNNPNMLRQWQNILPFGLACFSQGSREPSLQDDFQSGYSSLFILTAAEVAEYEDILSA